MIGGGNDDQLFGGDGADLMGGDSDDTPVADQGADYMEGGAGNDEMFGKQHANIKAKSQVAIKIKVSAANDSHWRKIV